ncbi:MAG: hypothetical protein ABH814_01555, partial [bacterium]
SLFDCEATVIITTRNGDPLYSPHNVLVEISKDIDKKAIREIIGDQLKRRDWANHIIAKSVFLPENELQYEK